LLICSPCADERDASARRANLAVIEVLAEGLSDRVVVPQHIRATHEGPVTPKEALRRQFFGRESWTE
jgi:hypothetical protein